MRYFIDPRQRQLFDYTESQLSDVALKRLKSSYHAVYRYVILELMPVTEIGTMFHPSQGRHTKELYSMAGLILLKEFHNWTEAEAVDAYLFDTRIQYALNLGSDNLSLCEKTLQRYQKAIREEKLARKIFDDITNKLIKELDLNIETQRLDSTHVFSDMATFGRTKLMASTLTRFLTQLKKHHGKDFAKVSESLLALYQRKIDKLFAEFKKDQQKRLWLRQQVAEDLHELIQLFAGHAEIENMKTFKDMLRVFEEQCEVTDAISVDDNDDDDSSQVNIKKSPGSDVMQNPSDSDATYDPYKGQGYQVQLSETCSEDNDVQLITAAIPQTASASDSDAVDLILEDLENSETLPNTLIADTLYGSDENHQTCAKKNIVLHSPVSGKAPKKEVEKTTDAQVRLAQRRQDQQTKEWAKIYNSRAGIEGSIGALKQKTGMVRLRYRGASAVFTSMLLKVAGWNIARAHASAKIRQKIVTILQGGLISIQFSKITRTLGSKQTFRLLQRHLNFK